MRYAILLFAVLAAGVSGYLVGQGSQNGSDQERVALTASAQVETEASHDTDDDTARTPAPPHHAKTGDVQAANAELAAEIRTLKQKVAFQEYLLEGVKEELHGTVEEWPAEDDMNRKYTKESFQQKLEEIVAECLPSTEILQVECEEPPCIASLRSPGTAGLELYEKLSDGCPGWTKDFGKAVSMASFEIECDDGHKETAVMLSPFWKAVAEPDDKNEKENHSKRMGVRWSKLRATWECGSAEE